jgi:taurine dioxygenase
MNFDARRAGVEIVPTQGSLGAEVKGLDLRQPIPKEILAELYPALFDNILLLFRDQDLGEQNQLDFCAQFGELYLVKNNKHPNGAPHPESRLVSNAEEHRKGVAQLHDSDMTFHHDTIFRPLPQKALCMHAIDIPSYGGNTIFNNMYMAYDALPQHVKDLIQGRRGLAVYAYTQTEKLDISNGYDKFDHAWHPVAITHPITGRKALYVNRLMSMKIEGMSDKEGAELLEYLFEHAENPEFSYEHVWRKGDTVLWDNLSSIHARTDIPKDQRRVLRHTSIAGIKAPEFA